MMICVIGDLLFDKYYIGSVNRISPEAPIPVVNIESQMSMPGGAANVTANLLELKQKVRVCGIVGADASGSTLIGTLQDMGADVSGILTTQSIKTIEKVRVVGNNHQIVRMDFNEGQNVPEELAAALAEKLPNVLDGCTVAIISDYGKGVCSPEICRTLIALCKERAISVIVDPKGDNWEKYRGAEWITPNVEELRAVTSFSVKNTDDEIIKAATDIRARFGIGNILVTRSEKGMTVCGLEAPVHIPAKVREVFDVSGAGDTVVAAFADALARGEDAVCAAHYANIAAGIVVGKKGTSIITRAEVDDAKRQETMGDMESKIMDWDTLKNIVDAWRKNGYTVCATNGCFDVFHKGHASLMQAASEFCDKLVVAVNSDASVERLKGSGRPINAQQDRACVLASLKYVDAVVIFEQDTPEELLALIRPDVLVKGGEYSLEQIPGRQYSGRVELVEYIDGYSTTSIVNKAKGETGD